MHTTTSGSRLQSSGCEFAPPWGCQQYCRQVSPSLWAPDSELLQLWDYSFYKQSFNYGSFRLLLTFSLMQFLFHVHVLVCHKKTKHGFFFFQKLQRTFSQVVSGITLQYHTWPVDRCGTIFWNKPWRGNFLYFHEPHCCYEDILYFYSYSSVPARPSWF